jgi:hypothetical protein
MSSKDASGTPHEESQEERERHRDGGERPLMSFSLCRPPCARQSVAAVRATRVKTWPHRARGFRGSRLHELTQRGSGSEGILSGFTHYPHHLILNSVM